MKKSLIAACAILVAVTSLSFGATLNSVNKDQVKQAFVDKTFTSVPVAHLDGQSIGNTFTGYLDAQGKTWGKFAHKPANAPQTDEGAYIIKDDGALCLTWQHWFKGKQFCVYTYNTNNAYIIVGDNNSFHTVFMKSAIQQGNHIK